MTNQNLAIDSSFAAQALADGLLSQSSASLASFPGVDSTGISYCTGMQAAFAASESSTQLGGQQLVGTAGTYSMLPNQTVIFNKRYFDFAGAGEDACVFLNNNTPIHGYISNTAGVSGLAGTIFTLTSGSLPSPVNTSISGLNNAFASFFITSATSTPGSFNISGSAQLAGTSAAPLEMRVDCFATGPSFSTDWQPRLQGFGIVATGGSGYGINSSTVNGTNGWLYGRSIRDISIQTGLSCVYLPHTFSMQFDTLYGKSADDHTFKISGDKNTYINLYPSQTGPMKGGYRLSGRDIWMFGCNGIDSGDFWGVFGQNNIAHATFNGYISNGTSGVAGNVLTVTSGSSSNATVCDLQIGAGIANDTYIVSKTDSTHYVLSGSPQAVGTSGSPISIQSFDLFYNDFPDGGFVVPNALLDGVNIEAFAQISTLASGIYISGGAEAFEFRGASLARNLASNYHSSIRSHDTNGNGAPIVLSFGSVSLSGGGVATTGYDLYTDTGTAFYDVNNLFNYVGIPSYYQGYNAQAIQTIQSSAKYSQAMPSVMQWNATASRITYNGVNVLGTSPVLTPVGSAQAISVTGFENILIAPLLAASISTITFSTSFGAANSDWGRNGIIFVESENGNTTLNHSASGANTIFLTGQANLTLTAGIPILLKWSTTKTAWVQI